VRESWDGSEIVDRRWSLREFLRNLPPVSRWLLIIGIVAFLAQVTLWFSLGEQGYSKVVEIFGLWPTLVLGRKVWLWQLVTYMFLHSVNNPLHIIFNAFIFVLFAPEVERAMAAKRFSVLYFGSGIVAGLFSCIFLRWIASPESPQTVIGASGAILGVLAAYGSIFPNRVLHLFMIFPIKAKHCVLMLAAVEILAVVAGNNNTNPIAWFAHAGGFIAGLLFMRYEWTVRSMLLRSIERHYDRELESDRQLRERVDELLVKVKRDGLASLTWREHAFLRRASKRFKKQHS